MAAKPRYTFHPVADEQQTDIWLYTYQQWGDQQADQYIDGLHEKLSKISHDPSLLRDLPSGIDDKVKFFHYGRHYVFLRKTAGTQTEKIQVLTILHDSMDIPVRLQETLEQL